LIPEALRKDEFGDLEQNFSMRIIMSESKEAAVAAVATLLIDHISSRPASVIGLATGKTMVPLYELWAQMARERSVDHSKCFFFLLDEYLGLPEDHPSSFRKYIETNFQRPLGLKSSQFAFPPIHGIGSVEDSAKSYERLLKESGGVDIQLLGIGVNGHIGFNEPGSAGDSRTRRVQLTEETRQANASHFNGQTPYEALSMGIGTILESKSLILLATGKSKADTIKYLLNHHDDKICPATFLKSHAHFTLVLDPDASSKINLKI
jgi:glucosamine-6-phosphate deaminase